MKKAIKCTHFEGTHDKCKIKIHNSTNHLEELAILLNFRLHTCPYLLLWIQHNQTSGFHDARKILWHEWNETRCWVHEDECLIFQSPSLSLQLQADLQCTPNISAWRKGCSPLRVLVCVQSIISEFPLHSWKDICA